MVPYTRLNSLVFIAISNWTEIIVKRFWTLKSCFKSSQQLKWHFNACKCKVNKNSYPSLIVVEKRRRKKKNYTTVLISNFPPILFRLHIFRKPIPSWSHRIHMLINHVSWLNLIILFLCHHWRSIKVVVNKPLHS